MFNENYFKSFRTQFNDVKIVAVKTPSFIKKVDYNEIVQALYETEISTTKVEDTFIKKQIANVNIGLLEKGYNKSTESFLYKTQAEAEYHKSLFGGGTIHMMQHITE